ncbi:MAG: hypothetical protein AB1483_03800 [Candidatus Zixiibacteriota bacterium]
MRKIIGLTVSVVFLVTVLSTYAEVIPEITLSGGYTDNLFNDTSSFGDSYITVSPNLKYYPSSQVEMAFSGAYTTYDSASLSNLSGSAAITIIPESKNEKLNFMISGGLSGLNYDSEIYEAYNRWGAEADFTMSYNVTPGVIFRSGASLGKTGYPNSPSGDSEALGVFAGLNFTPFGSNSLNLEAGYSLQRYVTGLDTSVVTNGRRQSLSVEGEKSKFQVANFSARYSRPFGVRTGFSAYFSQKYFAKDVESIIYGFSVDYLSPWYNLWDGWSAGANIKNYPGKSFILELGGSYTYKNYVPNLDVIGESIVIEQRDDERSVAYVRIQRPFSFSNGNLIRPTVQFSWVDNSSDLVEYDVSYYDITASLTFKF